MVLGRSQFLTFAAKYAKRSTVLRVGDAEHKFSLPIASDAASYVRFERGTLESHGIGCQPSIAFECHVAAALFLALAFYLIGHG